MNKVKFQELNLAPTSNVRVVEIDKTKEMTLEVLSYLPVEDKTKLLQFVIDGAIDNTTGTFSPLRVEVYFAIAVCHWYAGIDFTEQDLTNISTVYDTLENNHVVANIVKAIPEQEFCFMEELVRETVNSIEKYLNSAAGIIQSMNIDASNLDGQISQILEQIKNGEGLEQLAVIKDVVGKD